MARSFTAKRCATTSVKQQSSRLKWNVALNAMPQMMRQGGKVHGYGGLQVPQALTPTLALDTRCLDTKWTDNMRLIKPDAGA